MHTPLVSVLFWSAIKAATHAAYLNSQPIQNISNPYNDLERKGLSSSKKKPRWGDGHEEVSKNSKYEQEHIKQRARISLFFKPNTLYLHLAYNSIPGDLSPDQYENLSLSQCCLRYRTRPSYLKPYGLDSGRLYPRYILLQSEPYLSVWYLWSCNCTSFNTKLSNLNRTRSYCWLYTIGYLWRNRLQVHPRSMLWGTGKLQDY